MLPPNLYLQRRYGARWVLLVDMGLRTDSDAMSLLKAKSRLDASAGRVLISKTALYAERVDSKKQDLTPTWQVIGKRVEMFVEFREQA
jgi:hypothetical protein